MSKYAFDLKLQIILSPKICKVCKKGILYRFTLKKKKKKKRNTQLDNIKFL